MLKLNNNYLDFKKNYILGEDYFLGPFCDVPPATGEISMVVQFSIRIVYYIVD